MDNGTEGSASAADAERLTAQGIKCAAKAARALKPASGLTRWTKALRAGVAGRGVQPDGIGFAGYGVRPA